MRKSYRDAERDQRLIPPPSLKDWLPEGLLANFVVDVVEHFDISSIEDEIQARDLRGNRPYSPRMMVAVLFYVYVTGVYSSRRIARACAENVAFRLVSGNNQPFFTNIAEFRKRFLPQLGALQRRSRAGVRGRRAIHEALHRGTGKGAWELEQGA